MKTALRVLAATLSISLLGGCAATIPLKVAAKTTKLGVKTTKTGLKTTAKVAGAMIPNGGEENE